MQNFVTVKGKKSSNYTSNIHLPPSMTQYFHICIGDRASCQLLWLEDERMPVTELGEVSLKLSLGLQSPSCIHTSDLVDTSTFLYDSEGW